MANSPARRFGASELLHPLGQELRRPLVEDAACRRVRSCSPRIRTIRPPRKIWLRLTSIQGAPHVDRRCRRVRQNAGRHHSHTLPSAATNGASANRRIEPRRRRLNRASGGDACTSERPASGCARSTTEGICPSSDVDPCAIVPPPYYPAWLDRALNSPQLCGLYERRRSKRPNLIEKIADSCIGGARNCNTKALPWRGCPRADAVKDDNHARILRSLWYRRRSRGLQLVLTTGCRSGAWGWPSAQQQLAELEELGHGRQGGRANCSGQQAEHDGAETLGHRNAAADEQHRGRYRREQSIRHGRLRMPAIPRLRKATLRPMPRNPLRPINKPARAAASNRRLAIKRAPTTSIARLRPQRALTANPVARPPATTGIRMPTRATTRRATASGQGYNGQNYGANPAPAAMRRHCRPTTAIARRMARSMYGTQEASPYSSDPSQQGGHAGSNAAGNYGSGSYNQPASNGYALRHPVRCRPSTVDQPLEQLPGTAARHLRRGDAAHGDWLCKSARRKLRWHRGGDRAARRNEHAGRGSGGHAYPAVPATLATSAGSYRPGSTATAYEGVQNAAYSQPAVGAPSTSGANANGAINYGNTYLR